MDYCSVVFYYWNGIVKTCVLELTCVLDQQTVYDYHFFVLCFGNERAAAFGIDIFHPEVCLYQIVVDRQHLLGLLLQNVINSIKSQPVTFAKFDQFLHRRLFLANPGDRRIILKHLPMFDG